MTRETRLCARSLAHGLDGRSLASSLCSKKAQAFHERRALHRPSSRVSSRHASRDKREVRDTLAHHARIFSSLSSLLFSSLLFSSLLFSSLFFLSRFHSSSLLSTLSFSLSLSLSHTIPLSLSSSLVSRLPSIPLISRVSKSISPLVFRLPNTFRTKYLSSLILPTIPLLSSPLFFHAPECASSESGPFPCLPFSCHNRWGTCALSRRTRRPAEISAQKERTTAGLPASASARGARPHTLRTALAAFRAHA